MAPAGEIFRQFVREIWPFILTLLAVLLIAYVPAVVMFLPNLL